MNTSKARCFLKTKHALIWEDDEGIVHTDFFKAEKMDENIARENVKAHLKFSKGKVKPILFNLKELEIVTPSAAKYFINKDGKKIIKAAAVVTAPLAPIAGVTIEILSKLPNSYYPIKFFKRENEAIDWLRGFLISSKK